MRPKFKLPKYLIVSLLFYTLAACNSSPYVTVKTDYDHAAAFGKYHTYAIDMASTRLGPTTAAALQSSLRSSLAARGLKESVAQRRSLHRSYRLHERATNRPA